MLVTEIQRFCMHDGPGIRTVVFLQGCPLRCKWCHNPETQSLLPELMFSPVKCIGCGLCEKACKLGLHRLSRGGHSIDRARCERCGSCTAACPTKALHFSSREMSVSEIVSEVLKDRAFYGKNGGVTLSGGEPLYRTGEAIELLRACKNAGLNTAVETGGVFDSSYLEELVPVVDLFLWDVKDTDTERHRINVGVPAELPLENLKKADSMGAKSVMRCIIVTGQNDTAEHIDKLNRLRQSLYNCIRIDYLPCHMMSENKYRELGRECPLSPDAACSDEKLKNLIK